MFDGPNDEELGGVGTIDINMADLKGNSVQYVGAEACHLPRIKAKSKKPESAFWISRHMQQCKQANSEKSVLQILRTAL